MSEKQWREPEERREEVRRRLSSAAPAYPRPTRLGDGSAGCEEIGSPRGRRSAPRRADQRPLNFGDRFPRKAANPSL